LKIFLEREIREAYLHVQESELNSALHLHFFVTAKAPRCFRRDVELGYPIAHLLSMDEEFLREVAIRAGVKVALIQHKGTFRQHVDLCGKPLRNVLAEMGEDIEDYKRTSR
jgi:hypothetical protein